MRLRLKNSTSSWCYYYHVISNKDKEDKWFRFSLLSVLNEETMPKYLIYTYNTQPWKTNEKFLVVAPRHIKTGTNEEIKTATQISYCISLIICHTTSLLCHTSSSSTNSLNFYINSWSNLTPHNASTVTMPQTMFHPVYKILPPIFVI